MVASKERRASILHLHLAGCSAKTISKQLQIPLKTVYNNVNRYKATGTMEDKPRKGRPKSATTKKIVKIVREKIRRNPRRSERKMAFEVGISARSVGRIVTSHLRLRSHKIRKVLEKDNQRSEKTEEKRSGRRQPPS
uniref:HTH_Tnp_Tc3_2 domain-containing protein n=1 Tax=Haemonchus contortus TaxID=6289 RepID=A0A7I4XX48_HAECO